MKKTLREWFSYYEKKTHEKHVNLEGYKTLFDEEKGYCQMMIKDHALFVYEVCGDGLFWWKFVHDFMHEHSIKRVSTICTRNVFLYFRRLGFVIRTKTEREGTNGGMEMEGTYPYGTFKCFPVWRNNETGENAYCVVCEVKQ